jgi:hypothetical protein
MAKEATVTVTLSYANPAANIISNTRTSGAVSVDVAAAGYEQNVQAVTTAKAALGLGGVSTIGYCLLHNADSVNFISVYPNAADAVCLRLKAGEWALLRFDQTATPNVKADTATCNLEIFLLSN